MTSPRHLLSALFAAVILSSCGAFEHYDARYPTVSQQDAYDVQWGLQPRKSRGNPKLRYQYRAGQDEYSAPTSAAPSAPTASPEPTQVRAATPAAPAPISPSIPSNLR
jgi:hypothetical protein